MRSGRRPSGDDETPRPGAAPRLSRERILDTAVDLVDEHGLGALSMRRLGSALGVEAMALYRHVSDREDLLDGIVDRIIDAMDEDPEVLLAPDHGWEDFVRRLAHGIRRAALDHPSVFPLVVSQPPRAPWMRPPIRSVRWVEVLLDGLVTEGFDDEEAVAAYRSLTSFLLGYLLLEAAMHAEAAAPERHRSAPEGLASHPNVDRLQHELAKDRARAEFEEGLDDVVRRINRRRTSTTTHEGEQRQWH